MKNLDILQASDGSHLRIILYAEPQSYEWKTVRAWEAKDGKMIFYILPPRGKKAKP